LTYAPTSGLLDTNGLAALTVGTTSSAVNNVQVANAATTTGPTVSPVGTDTNINLNLASKGTGHIHNQNGSFGTATADSYSGTVTFDMSVSNIHTLTLAGSPTLAVSNVAVGQCFMIRLLQPASAGPDTVTWFSTIKWASGTTPTLTTTNSKADTFGFLCTDAGTYDGFVIGQNI
jgi:hypothetical protein